MFLTGWRSFKALKLHKRKKKGDVEAVFGIKATFTCLYPFTRMNLVQKKCICLYPFKSVTVMTFSVNIKY